MQLSTENLRERSMPELLDDGISLYRQHFRHFLGVAAVAQLPLGLLAAIFASTVLQRQAQSLAGALAQADTLDATELISTVLGTLLTQAVSLLVTAFGAAALMYSLDARLGEQRPGVLQAYRSILPRMPSFLVARLLVVLAIAGALSPGTGLFVAGVVLLGQDGGNVGVGALLVIAGLGLFAAGGVGALLLWVRWRFYGQTAVLEARPPVTALRRSAEVIAGSWWRTLGYYLLLQLLLTAIALTPGALVSVGLLLVYGAEQQLEFWPTFITNSVGVLTETLLLPVEVLCLTLLYVDTRVRTEALDIELALARLPKPGIRT